MAEMTNQKKYELQKPFPAEDIEWRVSRTGKTSSGKAWAMVLAYVTSRAIQDRLDSVFGIDGWQNEFKEAPDGGVMCGISVKFDGEWVTKWDGAENTNIEAVKGGLSGSMKRAGVQWGIGRYLYKLTENFVNMADEKPEKTDGWHRHYDKDSKTQYWWKTPRLPYWALPPAGPENDNETEV